MNINMYKYFRYISLHVTMAKEVVCIAWNFVKNQACRHFDHVNLVSIMDCNGNTVLRLDRGRTQGNTFKNRIGGAIRGKVIVGYNLLKFLRLINLDHPIAAIRCLAYFGPFVKKFWSQKSRPSLGDIALEFLRVDLTKSRSITGTVETARIVLDLWNFMQIYECADHGEKVHVARFLIHANADSWRKLLGSQGNRVNRIRKAASSPTGFQVTRLTMEYYERVVGVSFSNVDDVCQVIGEMLKEFSGGSKNSQSTLRLLLHSNMVQYVVSRLNVFHSLYQTSVSVFPLPAPGSAEQVVLLKGPRQGMMKTLEMMTKMVIQLEKDFPNQFYTLNTDFYDPAKADSKTSPGYGGFGKKIFPPPVPTKLLPSLTPNETFRCVKAKLSTETEDTSLSKVDHTQSLQDKVATDHCNDYTKLYEWSEERSSQEAKNLTLIRPPGIHNSSQHYSPDAKTCDQDRVKCAKPGGDQDGKPCVNTTTSSQNLTRGAKAESNSNHTLDTRTGMLSVQTNLNMTVSRVMMELLEQHMDMLTMPGVSIHVGEVDKDMEVVMSISGTEDQVRQAYSRVQAVVGRSQ